MKVTVERSGKAYGVRTLLNFKFTQKVYISAANVILEDQLKCSSNSIRHAIQKLRDANISAHIR